MSDDKGGIIGIQRRFPNGRKLSITGSKMGMFVPSGLSADGLLLVCEGATDTAAALVLGFSVIGRPNCNSRITMLARLVKGRDVVIVGDNDDVGRAGADKLAAKLIHCCPYIRIIQPPETIKDLREWLRDGLTSDDLKKAISDVVPIKTRVQFICAGKYKE